MNNTWVDFRAIKASVNMPMILEHYSIDWLRRTGDELRGRCPIHQGEGQDTFHVSLAKNAFNCFRCKAHGNVLDFVAAMEKCTVREAAGKLQQWFEVEHRHTDTEVTTTSGPAPEKGEGREENQPLKFQLKGIDPAHPYLARRGISKEIAEQFGLGFFSGKGSMHGRIVIPIHDENGMLLAYAGRAVDDDTEPKYKLPAGFHKSLVVYNLHRAKEREGSKVDTVVIVEGFFGAIKVHTAGYPCVALMGSSLSEGQADLLCHHFSGFVLMFDGDEAGELATDECLIKLGRRGEWVRAITLNQGAQPDNLSEGAFKQLFG